MLSNGSQLCGAAGRGAHGNGWPRGSPRKSTNGADALGKCPLQLVLGGPASAVSRNQTKMHNGREQEVQANEARDCQQTGKTDVRQH